MRHPAVAPCTLTHLHSAATVHNPFVLSWQRSATLWCCPACGVARIEIDVSAPAWLVTEKGKGTYLRARLMIAPCRYQRFDDFYLPCVCREMDGATFQVIPLV